MAAMEDFAQRLARVEDALAMLGTFLAHVPFGVAVYRQDGTVENENPAYRALFGNAPPYGKTVFDPAPAGALNLAADIRAAFTGKTVRIPAKWHSNGKGGAFAVETTLIPLPDRAGAVPHVVAVISDVTPHLKAQAEKEEAKAQQQQLLERMPVGVIVNNEDFRYTYWNPAAELIFGYSRAEVLGMHPTDLTTPESREQLLELLERIRNGEMDAHGNVTANRTKDGRTIHCEWHNTPLLDAEGRFKGKISIVQEVTDRVRKDRALAASEARQRMILDRAPIGIIINDRDYRYTYWNPSAQRIFGFRQEEVLGKTPLEVTVPPELRAVAETWMARLRTGEMEAHDISENVTKDGRRIFGEWHNTPLFDEDGNFAGKLSMVTDVTEEIAAQQEIAASRERLVTTLQSIGDAVIATDERGRVELMNPIAERLTGWHLDDALGQPLEAVFKIVNEDTREPVENPVTRVLRENRVIGLANHTALIARGGGEHPIADSGAPIRGPDGRILGVVLVFRDQAEERAAQAGLAQSEARYRNIVENSFEGIWTLNTENRITFMNQRMAELLGTTPEEIVGRDIFDFVDPAEVADANAQMAKRRQGLAGVHDRRFRKVNGETLWCQISAFPTIGDTGQYLGITSMAVDVTERRRADARLVETEARYRRIVENSFEGIWTLDSRDIVDFANGRMAQMLGGKPEQIVGRHILDFIFAEDHAEARAKLGERRNGKAGVHDRRFRRLDGSSVWCQVSAVPMFDDAQRYLGVTNMVVDVTERRNLEQQFLQSQKLEAVGRLAGGVAHDFNNLLTVILGYGAVLEKKLAPADPLRMPVEQIRKAGDRSRELTQRLLVFSRQQVMQLRVMSLNDVVNDMAPMLRRLLGEDVDLALKLDTALSMVRVDGGQMEQVVMNLCVNARDAMPRGGRMLVETSTEFLNEEFARDHLGVKPGPYVRLTVTDTGVGMSPETRQRLFEPFFTTKDPGKGTGLGLSTVYGIVRNSGGHIWVYSEEGHGSSFKIYLPAVDGPESLAVPLPARNSGGGNETVLLVEDEDSVRTLVQLVLEEAGYHVLSAGTPAAALQLAESSRQPIHVLLSDVVMPKMGGRELAERVRALIPAIKVVFMSGYTEDTAFGEGKFPAGAHFIQKPVLPDVLRDQIRQALDA